MRTEEIERELRAMRPEPDPDFARRLDEWAAADFPPGVGLGPRLAERARAAGPFRCAWDRLSSTPPRRILMPVGAAATAIVVVGIAISQGGGEGGSSPASRSAPDSAASSTSATPPPDTNNFDQVAPDSAAAGAEAGAAPAVPSGDAGGGVARGTDLRLVDATARLSLGTEASKVQDVANKVVDVTDSHQGIVSDSRVTTDQGGARASFSLEIPYDQLDAAMSDLSGLADVISRTEGGTDITAKAVRARRDLAATLDRIHRARIDLIQADTHQQKLVIQSQIDSLSASADAYKTQLKGVQRQARYATVDVDITSNGDSDSGGSGGWGIDEAFHDSGQVLEVIAGVGLVTLAVLLPLSLVAILGWAITSRTIRRRREAVLN